MNLKITYLDPDNRNDNARANKSKDPCVRCYRELTGKNYRTVHLINGGLDVLHPDDEKNYISDNADLGFHKIGADCAKKIGIEFTSK